MVFILIYASTSYTARQILWNNLEQFAHSHTHAWLLCHDFNEVTTNAHKFGGNSTNTTHATAFTNYLNNTNMLDLVFTGSRFTWSNKQKKSYFNLILEFDKYFANQNGSIVPRLYRTTSSPYIFRHCRLLLNLTKETIKPPPHCRLETMWFNHPDFPNVVANNWADNHDYFFGLNNFTNHIKYWNKHTFGNIYYKKNITLPRLDSLQKMDLTTKNNFHYNLENRILVDFNATLRIEEDFQET